MNMDPKFFKNTNKSALPRKELTYLSEDPIFPTLNPRRHFQIWSGGQQSMTVVPGLYVFACFKHHCPGI